MFGLSFDNFGFIDFVFAGTVFNGVHQVLRGIFDGEEGYREHRRNETVFV